MQIKERLEIAKSIHTLTAYEAAKRKTLVGYFYYFLLGFFNVHHIYTKNWIGFIWNYLFLILFLVARQPNHELHEHVDLFLSLWLVGLVYDFFAMPFVVARHNRKLANKLAEKAMGG